MYPLGKWSQQVSLAVVVLKYRKMTFYCHLLPSVLHPLALLSMSSLLFYPISSTLIAFLRLLFARLCSAVGCPSSPIYCI